MSTVTKKTRGRPKKFDGDAISFSVLLPKEVHKLLHDVAEKAEKSMGDLGRDALVEWLTAHQTGRTTVAARKRRTS